MADYITDSLLLLMKKKDYRDISITEICAKAGATRTSFYRNFSSKEDILKRWITKVTEDFISDTAISYENDTTRDYFIKLLTHMKRHQQFCTALYRAGLIHLIKDEFDRVFQSVYEGRYENYKSYFLSGGIYNVFLLWLMGGCRETPEQLAEDLAGILEK